MKAIRIIVADDHPVVRRGVRSLLETQSGWEVCGEACTGDEALEKVKLLKPNVLIIDISMPGMREFEAVRKIHEFDPEIGILALTVHDAEPMFRGAMEAGAHAYVLKSDLDHRLIEAVQALSENRAFFSPGISHAVMKSFVKDEKAPEAEGHCSAILTPRQLEVLRLLAQGNSNRDVAKCLGISTRTVEAHRYQIMNRLKVGSFSELVLFAVRNELVNP